MTTNGTKTSTMNKINVPKKSTMTEVQMNTLNTVIKLLNALPVQYRIETDSGMAFGALQSTTTLKGTTRKRCTKYPYGTVTKTIAPYLDKLEIGDVAQLPLDLLPLLTTDSLYSTIAGWCNNNWGSGAYKMCRTKLHIEVLRVA